MTQTIAPRVRTLVLLLLAAACALLAGAGPASAHAAVTGSDPGQGAVVQEAPARISLTFSEQVALSDDSLRVLDPDGKRVDTAEPSNVSGTTYAVGLKPGLPDGTYTVAYQVVSADSHPVAGAYTFSIGAPSKTSATVSQQATDDGLVGWLYGFGRYVSYAGFIVMAGGAAFVLACWRRGSGVRPVQRFVVSGWLALTAATLALLLLRGSYTGSGKVADVFDLSLLGQVLETKTGAALVSRLLLLAAAALFISVLFGAYDKREDPQERRDLTFGLAIGGVVVAAGLAASWAMSEHASVGLQAGISMPVDVVHLLAVAAWLGGLGALLVALYRAPADTPVDASAVRDFSRVAFGSVLALIATGTYQSWRQLGSWSAFTDTRYGQLLLAKIALVVVLVGVAWISRRWTGRLVEAVPASAERELTRVGAGAGASGDTDADVTGDDRTGTSTGRDADEQSDPEPDSPGPDDTESDEAEPADTDPADTERAAQLARQRAARDTARRKQLRDADPNRFGLRRSVLAEAGIAVVLLAVTTVLTQTEPGRTEQEAKAAASSSAAASADAGASGALTLNMPFDTGGEDGKGIVTVDLDPARVGDNEMHVYVERPNGRAFDIPEVKVDFTLKAKNIGPLPVTPDHLATGHWSANGVQIPMAGDWKVDVTVRTSDIDEVTVSKNAQIG
ncbi:MULTISPECIES: copper resistance CopC/CopD family protein [Streptomyces]|uniref:Copper resistance protein CopC n=1 Tax=Streptomyces koelreuteriae TaxID=2838015 RepID=A0ABX8FU46_9ACTN|nr:MULTISPECIES: copper resistance protein CopC [Streptomyces]QWB24537.1 copper resistance protein CopC [Streptomyces koelreuteriae]UUA07543.1 copper resistance protein CopC [Streptomyces koelreuteriae]UUA15172.1 copper resistance protein CopC [Streptomyces sp. CRCS-T-1]